MVRDTVTVSAALRLGKLRRTPEIEGWALRSVCLHVSMKENIFCPCRDSNTATSRPYSSCCTGYAIPAPAAVWYVASDTSANEDNSFRDHIS